MESGIYTGWVRHQRYKPVEHQFRNRIFLMYLDLDEIHTVFQGRWFWSARRPALARFCREDHMGDADQSLSDSIRDFVTKSGRPRPDGPIRLLTHLRYFGFIMNPVSFYFCFDKDSQAVQTVVAEVHNTPWGEQHCYIIDADQFRPGAEKQPTDKTFHVSPFMPMDIQYFWRMTEPQDSLTVNIDNQRNSEKIFDVIMQLNRREITTANLTRSLILYPLITGYVFAAIYWQALRLWMKRVPYYPHPKHSQSSEESKGAKTP
ncbi:MAG: DUF1365 domain-containing protein [Gimesia sp.]|nr:DUF1365 domain-containing protein [Gimesia sp.]